MGGRPEDVAAADAPAPRKPRYKLRPTTAPVAAPARADDPFVRPEAEDDDGYDPYSDRPAPQEEQFQRDPWD